MKIAVAVALSLLLLKLNSAEARCHGGYAGHLIDQRYSGCSGDLAESVSNSKAGGAVASVCMSGCYSAMFNSDLKSECDQKYAKALEGFQSEIAILAKKQGCNDSGSYSTKNDGLTVLPPDRACRWLSRTAVKLKCGSSSGANVCGTDKKGICAGELICSSSFQYGSQILKAGVFGVSCLSKSGTCTDVSISDCINDDKTELAKDPYYDNLIKPAVDSAKGIN